MDILDDMLPIDLPLANKSIIKVIGVGGGGGNAVNHMYNQGITDVSFVVCNTDNQDLKRSPVPIKVHLGKETTQGLGAGSKPEVAKKAAEESIDEITKMLEENTKMAFITAGMGGGTGTGASPVVARTAQEMNILTVGIVTIPFAFEGKNKIHQALEGIVDLSQYVDALLVINNEKLKKIYPDLNLSNAFAKADDVLTNAAKAIAEIITVPGYINIDFADVSTIMRNGKIAIMNTGYASGENRISKAIADALNSPLLNTTDVQGAKKILLSLYCSHKNEIKMDEISQIHDFMAKVGPDVTVIWGATFDEELDDDVKITLIATGYDVKDIPGMPQSLITNMEENEELSENKEKTEEGDDDGETAIESTSNKISSSEMTHVIEELYGESVTISNNTTSPAEEEIVEEEQEEESVIIDLTPEEKEPEIEEEDEDEIDIEDLEKEEQTKEDIPAWRRKFFKK